MPERHGYKVDGGWASGNDNINGNNVPQQLTIDHRDNNLPAEYKASRFIEFVTGFNSGASDNFLAYIADGGNTADGNTAGSGGEYNVYRYGFNGKENDREINNDEYDFGARIYDGRLGRWLSVDPLQRKYPGSSPYKAFGDNPIFFVDKDGRDIVCFDRNGREIFRIYSSTAFETRVVQTISILAVHGNKEIFNHSSRPGSEEESEQKAFIQQHFVKVQMPKIINRMRDEETSAPKYQKYDYQIAASTYLFNEEKNSGDLELWTDGKPSQKVPGDIVKSQLPDLDPTYVKALALDESYAGNGSAKNEKEDILQVNNGLGGGSDFDVSFEHFGFKKGKLPTPYESIHNGIKVLASKGFHGQLPGKFNFVGWLKAGLNHNGGGDKNYEKNVTDAQKTTSEPQASNYVEPKKPVKKGKGMITYNKLCESRVKI